MISAQETPQILLEQSPTTSKQDLKLLKILTKLSRNNLMKKLGEQFAHDNTILADFNFANGMKKILPEMKVIVKTIVIGSKNLTEPISGKVQRKEFNVEMKKYLPSVYGEFKKVFGNYVKDLSLTPGAGNDKKKNFQTIPSEKLIKKQLLKISRRAHKQFVKGKWDHSLKQVNDKDVLYWRQVKDMMKDLKKNTQPQQQQPSSQQKEAAPAFKTVDEKQYWRDVLKMMKEFKNKPAATEVKEAKTTKSVVDPAANKKKEEDRKYWKQVLEMMKTFSEPTRMPRPNREMDREQIKFGGELVLPNRRRDSKKKKNKKASPEDIAYWRQVKQLMKETIAKKLDQDDRDFIAKPLDRKLRKWSPTSRSLDKKVKKLMKPALSMVTIISFQSSNSTNKEMSKNLKQVLYNVVPYLKEHANKNRHNFNDIFQVAPLVREGIKDMLVRDTKLLGSAFRKNMWNVISKLNRHILENGSSFNMDELKLPFKMFKQMNRALKSIRKIDNFDILADSL